MFYSITGKIVVAAQNFCVVEAGGVAFQLACSDKSLAAFAKKGNETVTAYTYLAVREDAMELFGFATPEEKNLFTLLIGVDGVGPKAAVSILSVLSVEELSLCILSGDAKTIATAKGIGLKTAQKVILELKDKLAKNTPSAAVPAPGAAAESGGLDRTEAVNALIVLGYTPKDAAAAVQKAAPQAKNLQDLIRLALKSMGEK